jgi:hypothetical protein
MVGIKNGRARQVAFKHLIGGASSAIALRAPPMPKALDFRLFRHLECVVDFDAEVANGALDLAVT